MKYTADSWFFIQLSRGNKKALEIWNEIKLGKGRLVVPTIVIAEVQKRLLSRGLSEYAEELVEEIEASQKISTVNLTLELAKQAGKFGNSFNCTIADAVILATAVETGYINLITDDNHFIPAQKQGKISIVRFD